MTLVNKYETSYAMHMDNPPGSGSDPRQKTNQPNKGSRKSCARPLRGGGGVKVEPLRKNNFF